MKRLVLLCCLVVLAAALASPARAQVSGTKNIPGDYADLATAIADVNTNGVGAGGATLNLLAGNPQTAPAGGYVIGGAGSLVLTTTSAANPLVIQGNGNTITAFTPQVAGQTFDAIFNLVGADWTTITGLTLQENAANTTTALATNNMTEWGIALLYASTTDGAQNDTIQSNTITLNRTYANSFGIYSNTRHAPTTPGTNADATAAAGTNSNNKVYTNNISNTNFGIVFIGSGATAVLDTGNDIGGTSAGTGNIITDWGGQAATGTFISNITSSVGIYVNQQINDNISFNTVTSASVSTGAVALGGIIKLYSTSPTAGTVTTTNINNNSVTLTNSTTTAQQTGMGAQGMTTNSAATINMNSNLITGSISGVSANATFVGILNVSAPGTMNVNSNTIRGVTSTATTGGFVGIQQQTNAVVNTLNFNNNKIGDSTAGAVTFSAATTGAITGIAVTTTGATTTTAVSLTGNQIQGISTVTSGAFVGLSNAAAAASISINSNNLGTTTGNLISSSGAQSNQYTGISNTGGNTGSSLSISSNDFRGIVHSAAASATHLYIVNTAVSPSTTISNNTFTNLNVNTTGNITFISNSVTHTANTTHNVNSNSIVTAYNKGGAGGTVRCYDAFGSSGSTVTETNTGNNFSNMTLTGATTLDCWRSADGTTPGSRKTVTGNTFSNITGGTSAITVLTVGFSDNTFASNNISANTVSTVSGGGAVTGITSSSGNQNFTGNTVSGLSSTGASSTVVGISITGGTTQNVTGNTVRTLSGSGATSPVVNGISVSSGTTVNVSKNKIFDLSQSGAISTTSPAVNGILESAGTTVTTSNNIVGDLRAPAASLTDAIRGLSVTATTTSTTHNSYYNTVYINASSTGTNFGTTGVFHTTSTTATTATLNLRNNIIVNLSNPNGTGLTVAYRRSSGAANTLANYGASSNNNDFYAGTPGASRLIYSDGTSTAQTLADYKGGVFTAGTIAPRDSASISSNPSFLSLTGSNASFLHIDPSVGTPLESGAVNIAGITDDFDADIRQGNPGYPGTGTAPDVGADEFNGIPGCTNNADCNDSNVCTDDTCTAGTCSHTNNTGPCATDNNVCTDDVCSAGACTHQNNTGPCTDGNPCTDDICGGGTCNSTPNTAPCTDGNPCTDDICSGGTCISTNNTAPCEDGNPCTTGTTCGGGICGTYNTDPCTDGNPCTIGDTCSAGVCIPGGPPTPVQVCSTGGPIVIRDNQTANPYPSPISVAGRPPYICSVTANLNGLTHTFPDDLDILLAGPTPTNNLVIMSDAGGGGDVVGLNVTLADSGATTIPDAGPLVAGTFKPTNINDGTDTYAAPAPAPSASTTFAASFNGTNPNGTWNLYIVDDANGDTGTLTNWCLNIASACAIDADCSDGNVCTDDACVAGSCTHTNNTNSCDDGSACTTNDTCSGGVCVGGNPPDCNDGDVCTNDFCNPGTGLCEHSPFICNDNNVCTDDACIGPTTGCVYTPNAAPCSDGNGCTENDTCSGGSCQPGTPKNCDDSNVCTDDGCIPATGVCTHTNNTNPCSDGNACTDPDVCAPPPALFSENFDGVTAPALPAGWTQQVITGAPADGWVTSTTSADTAPNKASTNDPATISDKVLVSPSILLGSCQAQLTFRNNFNMEASPPSYYDGGVLEISINAGPFADIITAGGSFVTGGYTGTISTQFSSPIAGRPAWSGNSAGYITTTVNLPAAASGQSVVLRWRGASDSSVSVTGWFVDSIVLASGCPNSCTPGPAVSCDDSDACTDDACIAPTGCTHTTHSCDDSDGCTVDGCNPSSGCFYNPLDCSDGNQCTSDVCHSPAGTCDNSGISGVCDINGTLYYYRNNVGPVEPSTKPVVGQDITRLSSYEAVQVSTTNASGLFDFQDEAGNVSLTPTATRLMTDENECHNSITAADATQISKAAVGLVILTTNQRLAGDVSNNGTISSFDAALTAQKAVASPCLTYAFPVRTATGSDWAFRPVSRSYTPLTGIGEDYSFLGILYGDVTGNWVSPVLFGQENDGVSKNPSAETTLAESTIRIPTLQLAPVVTAQGKKKGAVLYLAGAPAHNQDGTWTVVLGLQRADGILGLDLALQYDAAAIHIRSVSATGIGSAWTAAGNDAGGEYRISLFGVQPLAGSGSFLTVTYDMTHPVDGLPFAVAAQANEGQIPITWSGVPVGARDPQVRVDVE